MELDLVQEGLKFMVLGMVTVFLFLILMVIIFHYQAKLVNKFFPPKVVSNATGKKISSSVSSAKDDGALIAAITAAIITFKNSKN